MTETPPLTGWRRGVALLLRLLPLFVLVVLIWNFIVTTRQWEANKEATQQAPATPSAALPGTP